MDEEMIKKYLDFATRLINDWNYSDIDGFCEDEELFEVEWEDLLNLKLKVSIDEE